MTTKFWTLVTNLQLEVGKFRQVAVSTWGAEFVNLVYTLKSIELYGSFVDCQAKLIKIDVGVRRISCYFQPIDRRVLRYDKIESYFNQFQSRQSS